MRAEALSSDLALFISQKRFEIVRRTIETKQAGEHPFFSEEGDLGSEIRIGKDHIIQNKAKLLEDAAIHQIFRICGPLAELNWPRGYWSELNVYWPGTASAWEKRTV